MCEELRCRESKQLRLSPHLEDQDRWRALGTDRVDVMEQRTKAQVMESGVNDWQAQTAGQQIMESEGVLTVSAFSSVLVRS